jgi:serine/threonine protein kinase
MARGCFAQGDVVGGDTIKKLIGQGGFGDIYCVLNLETNKPGALKVEMLGAGNQGILKEITMRSQLQGSPVFPRMETTGENDRCRFLVMELLGPSLATILRNRGNKYPLVLALRSGVEMLKCIEQLHRRGYIHRDVKPGNFLIRPDPMYPICLIDFGLAASYVDCESGAHLDPQLDRGFVGTTGYASENALRGHSLSRRDDLISWFHSLVEMVRGKMPWPDQADRETVIKMRKRKQFLAGLPKQVKHIHEMITRMDFEETPDYNHMAALMNEAIRATGCDLSKPLITELMSQEDLDRLCSFSSTRRLSISEMYGIWSAASRLSSRRFAPDVKSAGCCGVC